MVIDPRVPQSLSFLSKMARRTGKYSGSLNVVTRNATDFLTPKVAWEGEPVLSNSSTKFLLRRQPTICLLSRVELMVSQDLGSGIMATSKENQICLLPRAWTRL